MITLICELLDKSSDSPMLFLFYTLALYLFLLFIGYAIYYSIALRISKKTKMQGVMRVRIVLNERIESSDSTGLPTLDYGTYLIGMEDPQPGMKYPMHPTLSFREKAHCRRYPVSVFLGRYYHALMGAGLMEDSGTDFLKALLDEDVLCVQIGSVCCRSGKKGMEFIGGMKCKKSKARKNVIYIEKEIPERLREQFHTKLGCEVEHVCIMLEYLSQAPELRRV